MPTKEVRMLHITSRSDLERDVNGRLIKAIAESVEQEVLERLPKGTKFVFMVFTEADADIGTNVHDMLRLGKVISYAAKVVKLNKGRSLRRDGSGNH